MAVLKGSLNKKIIRGHLNRAAIKWVSTVAETGKRSLNQRPDFPLFPRKVSLVDLSPQITGIVNSLLACGTFLGVSQ